MFLKIMFWKVLITQQNIYNLSLGEKKQQIRAFFESNIDMEYELIVVDGDDYSEN